MKFEEEFWQREIEKLREKYPEFKFKTQEGRKITADYLKFFIGERKKEQSLYIKLCKFFEKIPIEIPDQEVEKRLKRAINLLGWDITPAGCFTFALFSLVLGFSLLILFIFSPIPVFFKILAIPIPVIAFYTALNHPDFKAREKVVESSEEMIFSILYMAIYIHNSPNLEGALQFSVMNLKGPMADDFKKLLWDIALRKYSSADEAMGAYLQVWEPYNKDYLEAMQLIRASITEVGDKREEYLNEASRTILDRTRERSRRYVQELKLPLNMLSGFGVLLPTLGIILLILLTIFMGSAVESIHISAFYNFILPIILYVLLIRTLTKRPPTTTVKLTEYKITARKRIISGLVAGIIFLLLSSYPIYSLTTGSFGIFHSLIFITSLGISLGIYWKLSYKDAVKFQKDLGEVESQFSVALFEFAHKLREGIPIELAVDSALKSTSNLRISGFFGEIARNIRRREMTFKDAVFDPQFGALKKYPSKLLETLMKAIVDAATKGTRIASNTMITISRYLQNLRITQEKIEDLLEDILTEVKFMGFVLIPIISGVVVGIHNIITKALLKLGESVREIPAGEGGISVPFVNLVQNLKGGIGSEYFQLIVGFYVIELLIIIGIFYTRVKEGRNFYSERLFTGNMLLFGMILYFAVTAVLIFIFGGIIDVAVGGITNGG